MRIVPCELACIMYSQCGTTNKKHRVSVLCPHFLNEFDGNVPFICVFKRTKRCTNSAGKVFTMNLKDGKDLFAIIEILGLFLYADATE